MLRTSRGWRSTALALALVLAGAGLVSCGSTRSVEAYCAAMEKHKARYLQAMDQANTQVSGGDLGGSLSGLAGGVAAIGDLSQMWDELADVAPEEISADVAKVRDSYADGLAASKNSMSDPLGAIGSQLIGGMLASGSMSRVDAWTRQNC